MYDVFISHSSEDKKMAEKMRDFLEDNGFYCWFAPYHIRGNEDFTKEIPQAIADSKAFLLLMSDNAQASKWVQRELGEADAKNIPIYTYFLEECELTDQYNFVLRFNQHYNVSLGDKEQKRRLLEDLNYIKKYDASSKKEEKKKTSSKIKWIVPLVCLFLVAVISVAFFMMKEENPDGNYVIWATDYEIAMSSVPINTHYLAGEKIDSQNGQPVSYSDKSVWYVDFNEDGTFTISKDGKNLGVEPGYNGIGLEDNYSADLWKYVVIGDKEYIQNVETGGYLEWYAQKDNWATHDEITDENRNQFLIDMYAV